MKYFLIILLLVTVYTIGRVNEQVACHVQAYDSEGDIDPYTTYACSCNSMSYEYFPVCMVVPDLDAKNGDSK